MNNLIKEIKILVKAYKFMKMKANLLEKAMIMNKLNLKHNFLVKKVKMNNHLRNLNSLKICKNY